MIDGKTSLREDANRLRELKNLKVETTEGFDFREARARAGGCAAGKIRIKAVIRPARYASSPATLDRDGLWRLTAYRAVKAEDEARDNFRRRGGSVWAHPGK
jgi:hypothetical protein